jgi:primosomal protein N' (replication factor Y)
VFIEVAFPIPLNRTFHYRPPNGDRNPQLMIGRRVLAPFGKKSMVGYTVGFTEETPPFAVKPIIAWIDSEPMISADLLDLAQWVATNYLCSVGEALASILPPQLRPPKRPLDDPGARQSVAVPRSAEGAALKLSPEQQQVLAQFISSVDARTYKPFLLRGITDSGKTELYLRTIDHVLTQKRQALFLLPEIALTPPFIDRLKARYGDDEVGVWHSVLSAGERYRTWTRARRGDLRIVLGARSAVFTPFPDLGVIVMDEEHEPSYKQEDRPRYHTRDIALWRAERAGATLIMGSATPSLESYWHARKGDYQLVELTSRVELRQLPAVTLVNRGPKSVDEPEPEAIGSEKKAKRARHGFGFEVFSEELKLAVEQRLARREQIILFVNRRGFTPFMRCSRCGWVARCERCSFTLALHVKTEIAARFQGKQKLPVPADAELQCHSCLRHYPVPIQCPSCKGMRLGQFGIGTQRVEEEVKQLFPFVKIARLDRDVAQFRKTYEKIYRAFEARQLDVLVGTQMIAKGFDFPGVTLVGVVDADVSLHLPDFRSAERTFQLMAQVAGRTGRGERGGKVIVQTHHPEHYALQAARDHDFIRFYQEEIPHREALNYPPACRLIYLLVRGRKDEVAQAAADELADKLRTLGGGVDVLGPALAPHSRIRGQFRYQIVLKGQAESLLPYREYLRNRKLPKAFLSVDIDPVDLL